MKKKTTTTKNLDRQQILEKLFKHNGFCMIHEETDNDTVSYNVKNIIGLFLDDMLAKGYHVKAIDGHNDTFVRFYKDVDEDLSQSTKTVYKYESSCSKENAENYINNVIEKCKNCCQDEEMEINLNDK